MFKTSVPLVLLAALAVTACDPLPGFPDDPEASQDPDSSSEDPSSPSPKGSDDEGSNDPKGSDEGESPAPDCIPAHCKEEIAATLKLDSKVGDTTVRELLDALERTRKGTWVHRASSSDSLRVKVAPDEARREGRFAIDYQDGTIHQIRSVYVPAQGDVCPGDAPVCIDRIDLEVDVEFSSKDQSLDEKMTHTLQIYDPRDPDHIDLVHGRARLNIERPGLKFKGKLCTEVENETGDSIVERSLRLNARFAFDGSVDARIEAILALENGDNPDAHVSVRRQVLFALER